MTLEAAGRAVGPFAWRQRLRSPSATIGPRTNLTPAAPPKSGWRLCAL